MTSETLKSTNPSFWANLQYVGLSAADVPAINQQLYPSGKATLQTDGDPYTGLTTVYVNDGGLQLRTAPAKVKALFIQEVMPVLVEAFPEVDQKYTGKIELHYREGNLTTFNLTH